MRRRTAARLPYVINPDQRPFFPEELVPDEIGLAAVGGDLSEEMLLEAYGKGIFPWMDGPPIFWFSPDPRTVLYPRRFHLSRRLARTLRQGRFTVRFDRDFEKVIAGCARVPRPGQEGTWISPRFQTAYTALFHRHLAHSAAVYRQDELVGGLYGVSLGRVFFGESMFSLFPDASKIALAFLVERLRERDYHFIDCQAPTEHLLRLGAEEIPRPRFQQELAEALEGGESPSFWAEG